MNHRREFIRNAFLAMGGLSLPGMMPRLSASNLASGIGGRAADALHFHAPRQRTLPQGDGAAVLRSRRRWRWRNKKLPYEVDLQSPHPARVDEPAGGAQGQPHHPAGSVRENVHRPATTRWCSSLGVFKANERDELDQVGHASISSWRNFSPRRWSTSSWPVSPPAAATRAADSTASPRASPPAVAQQPNYAFGGPGIAVDEIFKSVSADKNDQVRYQLERKVLEFAAGNRDRTGPASSGIEQQKVGNYAESIEEIRERNRKIDLMADIVRKHVPKLESKYLSTTWTPSPARSATPRCCFPR